MSQEKTKLKFQHVKWLVPFSGFRVEYERRNTSILNSLNGAETKVAIKKLIIVGTLVLLVSFLLPACAPQAKAVKLKPLLPDFDYADWYQSKTGWEVENYFGAWVLTAHKENVYIGFGSNAPSRAPGDGALLARVSGNQIEVVSTLDEQGIHTMVWHNDTLYIPGIDPHFDDGWDAGNFYRFVPPNDFKKFRYDKDGKAILPNVLHLIGLYVDPSSGVIYTTSWGGESADNPDFLLISTNRGESWEISAVPYKSGFGRIIEFNGVLYGANLDGWRQGMTTESIKYSKDRGKSWHELMYNQKPIHSITDFTIFKGELVLLSNLLRIGYKIDKSGHIEDFFIPSFRGISWPTSHWYVNIEDKFFVILSASQFYLTKDLNQWQSFGKEAHEKAGVDFFHIMGYWPYKKSLLLSVVGTNGGIWTYSLDDLFAEP